MAIFNFIIFVNICIINIEVNKMEEKIEKVLETIKPYLMSDGGNIEFIKYENKTVYVKLRGACSHCSLASVTLENIVLETLKYELPEIEKIINVEDEENE
jgi:Fe-S cluster biogenesis protein NfuA